MTITHCPSCGRPIYDCPGFTNAVIYLACTPDYTIETATAKVYELVKAGEELLDEEDPDDWTDAACIICPLCGDAVLDDYIDSHNCQGSLNDE